MRCILLRLVEDSVHCIERKAIALNLNLRWSDCFLLLCLFNYVDRVHDWLIRARVEHLHDLRIVCSNVFFKLRGLEVALLPHPRSVLLNQNWAVEKFSFGCRLLDVYLCAYSISV